MLFTVASAASVIVRADAMLENSGHWELRGSDLVSDPCQLSRTDSTGLKTIVVWSWCVAISIAP